MNSWINASLGSGRRERDEPPDVNGRYRPD